MANWSLPTLSSLYTALINEFKNRDIDNARMFSTAHTVATNIEIDTIRWNHTNKYWEKYNGSTWDELVFDYNASNISRGTLPVARIANNGITNHKLSDVLQSTIKGRASGAGFGNPTDLTATQVRTVLGILNTKVLEITNWDMESVTNRTVVHGLDSSKIRDWIVIVKNDTGAIYPIEIDLGSGTNGWTSADATLISVSVKAGGFFDTPPFSTPAGTRCWITVRYVD